MQDCCFSSFLNLIIFKKIQIQPENKCQHIMNPQILKYITMYATLQSIKSSQEDQ